MEKQKKKLISTLTSAPALRGALTEELVGDLIKNCETKVYSEGEMIFDQGDKGDGMYIILNGFVDILKKISDDDLKSASRSVRIAKEEVAEAAYEHEILQEGDDEDFKEERKKILQLKKNNLERAEKALQFAEKPANSQLSGYRYIVRVGKGEIIGETALLTDAPRNAALVVAKGFGQGVSCIFISKTLYSALCEKSGGNLQDKIMHARLDVMRQGLLDRVAVFRNLPQKMKTKILEVMRPVFFHNGDYITTQGKREHEFYIIIKGSVNVTINDDTQANGERVVRVLHSNDFFGEIALLNDEERTANCKAGTDDVCCMCLHKINFDSVIKGDLKIKMQSASDAMRMGLMGHAFEDEDEEEDSDTMSQSDAGSIVSDGGGRRGSLASSLDLQKRKESLTLQSSMSTNQLNQATLNLIRERGYPFITGALDELQRPTVQLKIPNIINSIVFGAGKETKESIAEAFRNSLSKKASKKTEEDIRFLMILFKHTHFFKKYCSEWAPHQTTELCRVMSFKYVAKSGVLYSINQPARAAFVMLQGKVEEKSHRSKNGRTKGTTLHSYEINVNECAGHIALEGVQMRVATAIAQFECDLIRISAKDFIRINGVAANFHDRFVALKQSSIFRDWPDDRLGWLVFHMKEKHFPAGSVILREGEVSSSLMMVMTGSVAQWQRIGGKRQLMSTLPSGSLLGALPIVIQSSPELQGGRSAKFSPEDLARETSTSVSQMKTKILYLSKSHYEKVIHSGYKTVDSIFHILESRRKTHDALKEKLIKFRSAFVQDVKFLKLQATDGPRSEYSVDHMSFPKPKAGRSTEKNRFENNVELTSPLLEAKASYNKSSKTFEREGGKCRHDPFYQYRKLKRYGMEQKTRAFTSDAARTFEAVVDGSKLPLLTSHSDWIKQSEGKHEAQGKQRQRQHRKQKKALVRGNKPRQKSRANLLRSLSPTRSLTLKKEKDIKAIEDINQMQFPLSPKDSRLISLHALFAKSPNSPVVASNQSANLRSSTALPGQRKGGKRFRPNTRQQSAPGRTGWVTSPSLVDNSSLEQFSESKSFRPYNSSFALSSSPKQTPPRMRTSVSSGSSLLPSSSKIMFQSDILRPSTSMSVVTIEDGSLGRSSISHRNVPITCGYRAPSLSFPAFLQSDRINRTKKLREEQEAEGVLMPWKARRL